MRKLNIFTEGILVLKARRKNKKAFARLYLAHVDSVYRYIFFRTGQDNDLAEDITQDVFLKAWDKITDLKSEKLNFRAWIFRIAHNLLVDHYRKSKFETRLFENIPDEKDLSEEIAQRFENRNILKAVRKLSPSQREIVIMKFIEGFSNKEIADVLKKKEDAIRALQYRALRQLKKMISK